jgi:hypothetical protein
MGFYRPSRNLEFSLIRFLTDYFANDNWNNVTIEKTFNRAYTHAMKLDNGSAVICIRCSSTNRKRFEIGNDNLLRSQLILVDIFATSDGQRMDLVDFIIDTIKVGFPYLEVQTDKAQVVSEIETGRVTINSIDDSPINFNTDKSNLDLADRFRHLISLNVSTGKAE